MASIDPVVVVVDTALPQDDRSLLSTPAQWKTKSKDSCTLPNSYSTNNTVIMDPDHYAFRLKFENPEAFIELIISNLTRFLDLPGVELEALRSSTNQEINPFNNKQTKKTWSFIKKKEVKGVVFGVPLTEESMTQIQSLTSFLESNLEIEGLFRKPGNSHRLLQLRAALNTGVCIDLASSKFHSHDVASILKSFLGELPEPLLQHKYFKSHLQIAEMTTFDTEGNRTAVPDKLKRIETLQLILLLLPTVNRTLLRGILDLLYKTAKHQNSNKMNAANLATMFCPHLLWPRNLKTADLQRNIGKLNDHLAFMIRHSQKIFAAPQYIRDAAIAACKGLPVNKDLHLVATPSRAVKRTSSGREEYLKETRSYTEHALKELFDQVQNMPSSAKKKKIVKNMEKHIKSTTPSNEKISKASRTLGGLLKKKVLSVGTSLSSDKSKSAESDSDFIHIPQPGSGTLLRSRRSLSRRKSSTGNKSEGRSNSKDTLFGSIRGVKASQSCDQLDSKNPVKVDPIPFPSLDDCDKENASKV